MEIQPYIETPGMGAVYAIRGWAWWPAGSRAAAIMAGRANCIMRNSPRTAQLRGCRAGAENDGKLPAVRSHGPAEGHQDVAAGASIETPGERASIAVGYLRRDGRTEPDAKVATASLNLRLCRAFLMVGGTYSLVVPAPVRVECERWWCRWAKEPSP